MPGRSAAIITVCAIVQAVEAWLNRQGNGYMHTPNGSTTDQPDQQYLRLAESALQHYTLGVTSSTFIQYNAAIVFRVEAPAMGRLYLLKLHARRGVGTNPSAAQLENGLRWLSIISAQLAAAD